MNGGDKKAAVDYAIQVPRNTRLKGITSVNGRIVIENVNGDIEASTVNGAMQVSGAAGDLKLSTVNGRITAELTSLGHGQSVSLNSVNGRIEAILPANANADVTANTVNGSITSEFPALVGAKGISGEQKFERHARQRRRQRQSQHRQWRHPLPARPGCANARREPD